MICTLCDCVSVLFDFVAGAPIGGWAVEGGGRVQDIVVGKSRTAGRRGWG
jgi:hypothetical protein